MSLIQFEDGIVVEIRDPANLHQQINATSAAGVSKTMETAIASLPKIVGSIGNAFKGLKETLDVPIKVGEAEVELGLSFSIEGNVYVAKSKAEGTLTVKISFTPV